jgi:excisionase family DNA binding protein
MKQRAIKPVAPMVEESMVAPGAFGVEDAGAYLGGFSRRTVYEMIDAGELRSFVYRRRRLIPKAECDRFLAAQAAMADGYGDDLPAA